MTKQDSGTSYHLWNPDTNMNFFLEYFGVGPTVITRGEGPYLFNDRGVRYINGNSSVWNVSIGLGREELVEAATKQMRELAFAGCFTQAHPRAIELAAKLVGDRNTKVPLTDQETTNIAIDVIARGLLISYRANGLRLLPPLIIDKDIADVIINILDKALYIGMAAQMNRKVRLAREFALSKLKWRQAQPRT